MHYSGIGFLQFGHFTMIQCHLQKIKTQKKISTSGGNTLTKRGACVFGVNRGHTLAYFHTNEDTHDTEDRPRFVDRCNRLETA